ncbi:NAD-dependent deacylase [Roseovarius nitratireducens]|uniref:NAD-dependent deacylase n=1 Tax=Roseovarius nitratireducens TaxID=2044597 RepID=UPI000CE26996|nr:NAD-dependent deacylase [Roseovarius nitratireducens]
MEKIVILTGAGISAESGLATFRDAGGLWAKHRIEDVATPEAFIRDAGRVHRFYNTRRAQAAGVRPNAAHAALAWLQAAHPGEVVIVTQNVDALHEAAGSRGVIHMHGELARALCAACGHRWDAPPEMSRADACPACGACACRPDVVWFGEMPYRMEEILDHLAGADLFAAIGTSGQVWPAAGFAQEAAGAGAHCVEINLEASAVASDFHEARQGRASRVVPEWVAGLIGEAGVQSP